MLVEPGRRQPVVGGRLGEGDRVPDRRHHRLSLADLDDRVQPDLGGEPHAAVDGVDRPARHAGGDDHAEPVQLRPGHQPLDEQRSQLVAVRGAVLVAREARVVGQLGDAEHLDQLAELPVVAGGDDQLAVGAHQRLVGEQAGVAVAHPLGDHAAGHEGAGLVDHPRQGGGEQVDLDVLAATALLAGVQRGEDADRGVQPGHHVEDRDAGAEGLGVGAAGEAHQARHRLDDQVVAGQYPAPVRRTEAADRGVDDPRVGGRDGVVVEAEARETAGAEVLHHDVGAAGELLGERDVAGVLEVEGDGALVAVDPEVVRRDAVAHGRLPRPGVVAGGRLDLDHLGAEVGEQHRGVGAGQDPREVGDQQPRERSGRSVGHGDPLLKHGHASAPVFRQSRSTR